MRHLARGGIAMGLGGYGVIACTLSVTDLTEVRVIMLAAISPLTIWLVTWFAIHRHYREDRRAPVARPAAPRRPQPPAVRPLRSPSSVPSARPVGPPTRLPVRPHGVPKSPVVGVSALDPEAGQ